MEHLIHLLQNPIEDESFFIIFSLFETRYRPYLRPEFVKHYAKIGQLAEKASHQDNLSKSKSVDSKPTIGLQHETKSKKHFAKYLYEIYVMSLLAGETSGKNQNASKV